MFDKCRVCGATSLNLFRHPEACPKCGAPVAAGPAGPAPESGALGLPQRKNPSRGDRLKLETEKSRHNFGTEGTTKMYFAWDQELQSRPLDIPAYTALGGMAHIAVLLSRGSIPQPAVLEQLAGGARPFLLHAKTFLDAGYPILRMNLYIPDNPTDPLCLESPLDIRDGDAQDFLEAVQQREHLRLVLAHESAPGNVIALAAQAPGLAALLREEVHTAVRRMPGGAEGDFRAAAQEMERAFPRPTDGIDPKRLVKLQVKEEVDYQEAAQQIIDILRPYFQRSGSITQENEKAVQDIGWKLHRCGGKQAMLEAFEIVRQQVASQRYQSARALEAIWDGVGDWRG
jgi:hypothetical protein